MELEPENKHLPRIFQRWNRVSGSRCCLFRGGAGISHKYGVGGWERALENAARFELLISIPSSFFSMLQSIKPISKDSRESFFLVQLRTRWWLHPTWHVFFFKIVFFDRENELHSGKLTWRWKDNHLKIYLLLSMVMFHCHLTAFSHNSDWRNMTTTFLADGNATLSCHHVFVFIFLSRCLDGTSQIFLKKHVMI